MSREDIDAGEMPSSRASSYCGILRRLISALMLAATTDERLRWSGVVTGSHLSEYPKFARMNGCELPRR